MGAAGMAVPQGRLGIGGSYRVRRDGMTNSIYDDARYKLLTAGLNWTTIPLRLAAWGGTPNFVAADKTLANISARTPLRGYSQPITSQTVDPGGTAQTNQVVIPKVPVGTDVTWFTMVRDVGLQTAAQLILYIDDAVELPFTPNGLDIVVQPDWLKQRGWFRP